MVFDTPPLFDGTSSYRTTTKTQYSATSVETTFLWTVALFGTAENVLLVLSAICLSRSRRVINVLACATALADLYTSAIYIPYYTYVLADNTNGTTTTCSTMRGIFLETTNLSVTLKLAVVLHLVATTVSRHLAQDWFSFPKIAAIVTTASALKFCATSLPGLLDNRYSLNIFKDFCTVEDRQPTSGDLNSPLEYSLVALALNWTEFLVMGIALVRIHFSLRKCRRFIGKNDLIIRSYRRATIIMRLTSATICICWLPIYVISAVDPSHQMAPDALHKIALDLLFLRVAIDPVISIYGFRSIRVGIDRACMGKCSKWRAAGEIQGTKPRSSTASINYGVSSVKTNNVIVQEVETEFLSVNGCCDETDADQRLHQTTIL